MFLSIYQYLHLLFLYNHIFYELSG